MNFIFNFFFTVFVICCCSSVLFMLWNWAMESFASNRIALRDMDGYQEAPGDTAIREAEEGRFRDEE